MQISDGVMGDMDSEWGSIQRTMVLSSFRERDQDVTRPSENRSVPEAKGGGLRINMLPDSSFRRSVPL